MFGVFYGWWVVCACFPIALYVSGITVYGFTAFIEPFAAEFQWSYTQISFAQSLCGFEAGIFNPVIGVLADRFGSRKKSASAAAAV
jgi:MFS family permease